MGVISASYWVWVFGERQRLTLESRVCLRVVVVPISSLRPGLVHNLFRGGGDIFLFWG